MEVENSNLTEELKEELLDLITQVKLDPTPENLIILGNVLKKWEQFEQYVGALMISSNTENVQK